MGDHLCSMIFCWVDFRSHRSRPLPLLAFHPPPERASAPKLAVSEAHAKETFLPGWEKLAWLLLYSPATRERGEAAKPKLTSIKRNTIMLNNFVGIGRIGQDAEAGTTSRGEPMARFSIAIPRSRKREDGLEPDWIRCTLFGQRAANLGPYLRKGRLIGIRGRLSSYRTMGENPRTLMSVDVSGVDFLERAKRPEADDGEFSAEARGGSAPSLVVQPESSKPARKAPRRGGKAKAAVKAA